MVAIPNTLMNEQAVVAACLDGDAFAEVAQIVQEADFTTPPLATAFRWMHELFAAKRPVDLWTIQQAFGGNPALREVQEAIQDAPAVVPGSAVHFAHILADRAAQRRAIITLQNAAEAAAMANGYQDARIGIEAALMNVVGEKSRAEIVNAADAVEAIRRKQADGSGTISRFPTGFPKLDAMLNGGPGEKHLIIVAGPTSGGKTTLAGNVITNIAESGVPCGVFSLEMSTEELIIRCGLSMMSEVRQGADPLAKVAGLPLWISDNPDRTAESIRGAIRLMVLRFRIKVVVVDYIQLINESDSRQSRERQVAAMSRHLKLAAKESGVCILALSQLNEDGRLRESKAIENDADGIIYIVPAAGRHWLWVAKNRHGDRHGHPSKIDTEIKQKGIPLDFHNQNFRFTEC